MNHTEDGIQRTLVVWLTHQYPREARWFHHSPNGGLRSKATAGKLKAAGTRRGFPDLVYPVARGPWRGLAIELKAPGGRATPEQAAWIEKFAAEGWCAVICVGLDAAVQSISGYMRGET